MGILEKDGWPKQLLAPAFLSGVPFVQHHAHSRPDIQCISFVHMYKLYVRPNLDCGDMLYHIPQNICEFSQTVTLTKLMGKLEPVQYFAALAVTGAWKGTSRQKNLW